MLNDQYYRSDGTCRHVSTSVSLFKLNVACDRHVERVIIGLVVELVYTKDLKSFALKGLRVRVPSRLPRKLYATGDLKPFGSPVCVRTPQLTALLSDR